jgi:hypothetical protein
LLPRCRAASLPRCLAASLPCCLAASLPRCLAASLPRCLAASLPRCLAASLRRCVGASVCRCCCEIVASLRRRVAPEARCANTSCGCVGVLQAASVGPRRRCVVAWVSLSRRVASCRCVGTLRRCDDVLTLGVRESVASRRATSNRLVCALHCCIAKVSLAGAWAHRAAALRRRVAWLHLCDGCVALLRGRVA